MFSVKNIQVNLGTPIFNYSKVIPNNIPLLKVLHTKHLQKNFAFLKSLMKATVQLKSIRNLVH